MRLLKILGGSFLLFAFSFSAAFAQEQPAKIGTAAQVCEVESLVINAFNFLMAVLPFIALGALGYGAWLWMSSAGDPQKLLSAKDTLTYAVIGLVVALSAVLITLTIETFLLGAEFKWTEGASTIIQVNICEDETGGSRRR